MYRSKTCWMILACCLSLSLSTPPALAEAETAPRVRLLLLGTKGGPSLLQARTLPQSSVLLVGDDAYLVDAGYGASLRLVQAGIPLRNLKGIFITHLHSDHVLDYPSLLMNAWASGLRQQMRVFGPPGTQAMTEHLWQAFDQDISLRIAEEGKPDPRPLVLMQQIDQGPVYADSRIKVSALRVPHPPFDAGQAFAYRFEVGGRVIVFSGDTTYHPPLAQFARDADVLVNEVVHVQAVQRLAERIGGGSQLARAIIGHHVTGEDVGRIASAARVKKLVLSHFVPGDDPLLTPQSWRSAVAQNFDGEIVVGEDGMEIALGD